MKVTKTSTAGIELIKKFESFAAKPYKCSAGVPTIGYGATYYPDGRKVTLGDPPISEAYAVSLLEEMLVSFEKSVDSFCRDDVTQNQFDALVCFAYNVGTSALKKSTLLKKVNENPSDPTIKAEFLKWNKAAGRVLKGLTRRRVEEAALYFKA